MLAVILVNYRDYARRYLDEWLVSFRKQNIKDKVKLFIVDNKSTPETFSYLQKKAPEAEIIRNTHNDGFAKGNNDGIRRALKEGYQYIALFNLDTSLEEGCLAELVRVIKSDKSIGAVQARLMLYPEKDKINSLGNVIHFLGFGYCSYYRKPISDIRLPASDFWPLIAYPSGAAVLFRREALEDVGLFDEKYWMYNEDEDLGWRMWLRGWKNVLAPQAVVYHKYEFSRSIKKYYWMERNRLITIFKNYHWLTLLLITPAFWLMEAGMWLFALKGGWAKEKWRVYKWFMRPRNWRYLWQERQRIQRTRKAPEKEIIKLFSGRIWYQEIDDWRLRLVNPFFNFYFQLIKIFYLLLFGLAP